MRVAVRSRVACSSGAPMERSATDMELLMCAPARAKRVAAGSVRASDSDANDVNRCLDSGALPTALRCVACDVGGVVVSCLLPILNSNSVMASMSDACVSVCNERARVPRGRVGGREDVSDDGMEDAWSVSESCSTVDVDVRVELNRGRVRMRDADVDVGLTLGSAWPITSGRKRRSGGVTVAVAVFDVDVDVDVGVDVLSCVMARVSVAFSTRVPERANDGRSVD